MDGHDIGRGRGGIEAAFRAARRRRDLGLTGIGIEDDILYGPRQVRALVDAARRGRRRAARTARSRSTKGHDAFLVEWEQLTALLREALAD